MSNFTGQKNDEENYRLAGVLVIGKWGVARQKVALGTEVRQQSQEILLQQQALHGDYL